MERGPLSAETPETEGTMKPECLLIQSLLERQRKGTMHAREGKAKKICLGRRKKKGKKKRGGLRDKRRAVPLCPIEGPIVGELPHVFVLIAVRRRQKSCDSINEMTFVRPCLVAPPSLSGSHKSPHWAPSMLLPE